MPVFKLTPVNADDPDWKCSSYCGEVRVRAENEHRARTLAARSFALFDPIGQGSCLCTWESEAHTRCEKIQDSPADGEKPAILFPALPEKHAHLRS